jgi:CRISPR locus-related DNA-binding protein
MFIIEYVYDNKKMNIIIATVGQHPEGIIESIKKFPCDKLILIADEWSKDKSLPKIKEVSKSLDLSLEIINVNPYDAIDIVTKLKEAIRINKGSNIILNITGGTKVMAIAGTLAGIAVGDLIREIIYISEDDNKIISIPRLLTPSKLLSSEKRKILHILAERMNQTADELRETIKGQMQAIWKHLRELEEMGYIKSSNEKPKRYLLTESGWLLT